MISTFNKRLKNGTRLSSEKTKREESSGDESNDDSNSDEEKLVARRSDVSRGVLKASLDVWDDFETRKDDSEDDDDPYDNRFR